ncbi:MAG: acyl-CoA thioesterase [Planctomycetota bacterium]|nr:acyl-CoA thioesterase [Planctomycetota bacterium]
MSRQSLIANHPRTDRIRWVDVDANRLAHFDTYLRLMEETEYSFLRHCGLSVVLQDEKGTIGFPRLSVQLSIERPLGFAERVETRLGSIDTDGKQISYHFQIRGEADEPVAHGRFDVACCRFPDDALPYAILIPDFILQALSNACRQHLPAKTDQTPTF